MNIKSTDNPWITRPMKRKGRQRKRTYAKEGKSERYLLLRAETDQMFETARKQFFEKAKKKTLEERNNKKYFQAVKMLGSKEAPTVWNVRVLFKDKSDYEIAEILAQYFNRISLEFIALEQPSEERKNAPRSCPEIYQIAAKLKKFRKPNSRVKGDIPPVLINEVADFLAIPLHYIFSRVYQDLEWPTLWKNETVSIIPKNAAPADVSQLRNMSCTPLFSKLLESFVLEQLKQETKLSDNQYGGLKGISADHFLIGTWQSVLETLEDPRAAASVLSIDFEKAFNRMCHHECLRAISSLGASEGTTGLVHAFLYQRQMSVKIGDTFSDPRIVAGGSPQGSILGNYLFCATTESLLRDVDTNQPEQVSYEEMTTEGDLSFVEDGAGLAEETVFNSNQEELLDGEDVGEETEQENEQELNNQYNDSALEESISFFRTKNRYEFDSDESDIATSFTQPEIDRYLGIPPGWHDISPDIFIYIDDANAVE